jgi:hypothetical protein
MNDHIFNDHIFIAIPAFNEKFTHITVEDAFAKADNPHNVYIGIFNQKTNNLEFEDFSGYKNVRCVNVTYKNPLGLGLARVAAASLLEDEEYFLQLDAHTIFAKGWDTRLLGDLKELLQYCDKPLISQSLAWHREKDYFDNDQAYIKNFYGTKAYPLYREGDVKTHPDHSRESEEKILGKFLEHYLCYGGFLFGESKFLYDISYNPFILMDPEQEITALRASTRGYRFFSSDITPISTLGKGEHGGFTEEKYKDDIKYEFLRYDFDQTRKGWHGKRFYQGLNFGFYGAETKELYDEYFKKIL